MLVSVQSILGVGSIPKHRTSATRWLVNTGVRVVKRLGDARQIEEVAFSDLPSPVRRAYVERQLETAGQPPGAYDETAHERLAEMPPKMRAEAERKAEIARVLLTVGKALPWSQKLSLIKSRFGSKGVSQPSLTRLLTAIKGVDPINFAPALMADYRLDCAPSAPLSDAAWSFFMTTLRDAGEQFPLQQAWRDVRDVAPVEGWNWPSWPTVYRAFKKLPLSQQLHARIGQ